MENKMDIKKIYNTKELIKNKIETDEIATKHHKIGEFQPKTTLCNNATINGVIDKAKQVKPSQSTFLNVFLMALLATILVALLMANILNNAKGKFNQNTHRQPKY